MKVLSFIFSVICLISVYRCNAACKLKRPQSGYTGDKVFKGTYYLIAIKQGFNFQSAEDECIMSYVTQTTSPFNYTVLKQSSDGSKKYVNTLTLKDVNNMPGVVHVTGTGEPFTASVIGFISNKIHVIHACNQKNGDYAVWVHNIPRVKGLADLDSEAMELVKSTLKKNNIPMSKIKDIGNSNCGSS